MIREQFPHQFVHVEEVICVRIVGVMPVAMFAFGTARDFLGKFLIPGRC